MISFVKSCREDFNSVLSAFAIVQQIYRKRLVIKGIDFENGRLSFLMNTII